MARAMRSLSEPVGFCPSSFAQSRTPGFGERRWMPTRGVFPMASRMSLARTCRLSQRPPTGLRRRGVSVSEAVGYPSSMRGSPASRVLLLASLLMVAAACGSPSAPKHASNSDAGQSIDANLSKSQALFAVDVQDPHAHLKSGVSLLPLSVHLFVFGPDDPAVTVQAASNDLVGMLPKASRLHVLALPS